MKSREGQTETQLAAKEIKINNRKAVIKHNKKIQVHTGVSK